MAFSSPRKEYYHETAQQNYAMKRGAPITVSLDGAPGGGDLLERRRCAALPSVGIVVMTKRPLHFAQWLTYHRQLGIRKFYVHCEDTPELAALLRSPINGGGKKWSDVVEATFVEHTRRDYFLQMDRQATHVAKVVPRAVKAGLDWLLHVDDDELLYAPSGVAALFATLGTFDPQICDAHLQNVEALAPDAYSGGSCFTACSAFLVSTRSFASYTNGKSFGRVSPDLRALGPHHFTRIAGASGTDGGASGTVASSSVASSSVASQTTTIPSSLGVVLHYESCSFERWSEKFRDLADRHGRDPAFLDKLPFSFYRESLQVMLHLSLVEEEIARCVEPGDHAAGERGKPCADDRDSAATKCLLQLERRQKKTRKSEDKTTFWLGGAQDDRDDDRPPSASGGGERKQKAKTSASGVKEDPQEEQRSATREKEEDDPASSAPASDSSPSSSSSSRKAFLRSRAVMAQELRRTAFAIWATYKLETSRRYAAHEIVRIHDVRTTLLSATSSSTTTTLSPLLMSSAAHNN